MTQRVEPVPKMRCNCSAKAPLSMTLLSGYMLISCVFASRLDQSISRGLLYKQMPQVASTQSNRGNKDYKSNLSVEMRMLQWMEYATLELVYFYCRDSNTMLWHGERSRIHGLHKYTHHESHSFPRVRGIR